MMYQKVHFDWLADRHCFLLWFVSLQQIHVHSSFHARVCSSLYGEPFCGNECVIVESDDVKVM